MPVRHFIGILLIPTFFLLFIQPSFADVSADTQKYKESQKYIDEGFNFYKLGQYEKAIDSFKEAIRIRPDNADAYFWLGNSYGKLGDDKRKVGAFKKAIEYFNINIKNSLSYSEYLKLDVSPFLAYDYYFLASSYSELGQYEKAIEFYKEGLKLKPDDPSAYVSLGNNYKKLGQYEKAIESYKEAIKLKPDDTKLYDLLAFNYELLAFNYQEKGQYEKAIESYKEALNLKPEDAGIYRSLGFAYSKLKQYEKAIEAYKEAIRLKPDDAKLYYFLASSYERLGQYDKAIESYKESLKLNPNNTMTYQGLGFAYSQLKQYDKAIEAYKEAIRLKPDDASTYRRLGFAYSKLKQYEKAIEAYKEAIRLKPDDAELYYFLASSYERSGQYDKAVESYKEALRLKPDDADSYRSLGFAYSQLKQYDRAIDAYIEAIRLKPDDAELYNFLAFNYKEKGQYEKAIESYKEVLRLKPDDADTYSSMGFAYRNLKQYEKAIDAYKKVVKLKPDDPKAYERLGDAYNDLNQYEKAIEVYKEAIKLKPDYADAHESLGFNYLMLGNQAEAVNYLKIALGLYRKLNDKENEAKVLTVLSLFTSYLQGKDINLFHDIETALGIYEDLGNSIFKGIALRLIAGMHSMMGENKKAMEYYRKALENYEKLGDDIAIADTLIDIAENTKNYEEMMKYGKQALEIINKYEFADNIQIYLTDWKAYKIITIAHINFKDYNNAEEYAGKMVKVAQEMKKKGFMSAFVNGYESFSYFLLGQIMILRGYNQEGLKYYQDAVNLLHDLDMYSLKWLLFWRLGVINDVLGNLAEARNQYFNAVNNLEKLRESAQSLSFKISLGTPATDVYTDTILFLLKTKEDTEAFNYMERARSRVFLDLLGGKLKIQNKEVIEEERRLQFRINYLSEKIREANERPDKKVGPQMVILLEKQLNDARAEYASLLEKIKKENPEISTLLTVNPLTLKEVQNLLDPDTTLLEYFITPEKTLLWVVDKQNAKVLTIDIKSQELALKVEAYREKISKLQPDYRKDAEELYGLLIKPAEPYIKTKRIGIVPHSVLHYLPFQALLNKDKFLIEEYDIFYAPSASVLKFVYEKRKEIKGKVLAFGNPKLDDENLDLPYAEDEVRKIKTAYPETTIYLKEKATEDKAKKLSGDYNIIHFASHGELNPKAPMFSSIRLAKDKDEDGRLDINEIFNLDLKNTSLVTLSACETGLGKLTEGDELVGLTRGFIYAGTPSIVASLWRVNDQSTSELMNLFYKNLKNHPKSEALRMAQLEMIRGKTGKGIVRGVGGITATKKSKPRPQESETVDGSHPYFWAPFILLGDWK